MESHQRSAIIMSDDANIGACALLAGIRSTAEAFRLPEVRVMAALLCLHPDQTPFLRRIREMMLKQTRSMGEEAAARNFGVSPTALKLICRVEETKETPVPAAPKPPAQPNVPADNRSGQVLSLLSQLNSVNWAVSMFGEPAVNTSRVEQVRAGKDLDSVSCTQFLPAYHALPVDQRRSCVGHFYNLPYFPFRQSVLHRPFIKPLASIPLTHSRVPPTSPDSFTVFFKNPVELFLSIEDSSLLMLT